MCLFVILTVKMLLLIEKSGEMAEKIWKYGKNVGHREAGL